ncbi:MAG: serine/threonine-protein kinase, partial [Dehalococcoidia bacterium]|nr:serine/threonine-protein kinase [Dehalococcoidia bacterium]
MPCLTEEQLDALAAGELSDTAAELLCAHLGECRKCQELFDECRENHPFAADLRVWLADGRGVDVIRSVSLSSSSPDSEKSGPSPFPSVDGIPGYEIVREIHRGGQGVVYEAVQVSTNRTVAVKVMLEGPFVSERARWRFEREVKLIARLRHPNIVVIHDSGIAQKRYYFAMDYVRGEPLDTHIRLSALPTRGIVRIFLQVCDAVSCAHRHGVIHRDLKPSNILVGDDGRPQVLDFGLAKTADEQREGSGRPLVTMPGQIMGTIRYMSPEQARG